MASNFPRASGKTDIGSDLMRMIPILYAGKLLVKYYDASVLNVITNTTYEGTISEYGDKVFIRTTPDMVIRDYVKGQTLVNDQPESTATSLTIDKGKYWSFVSDDVDRKQTDVKQWIEAWTDDAAEQMKINIDTDVLANVLADAHASNVGAAAGVISGGIALGVTTTPLTMTAGTILEKIVDMGVVLDEQNVPETGRFLVMNPLLSALVKKSDLRDASIAGDATSLLRNGMLGMIDRFTLFNSNLLAGDNTNGYACIFGHSDAITFATQLVKSKTQDNPNGFGLLHRGLQVYGYDVVKPEALGVAYLIV